MKLFVAGLPACGKSKFCEYVKGALGFAHFDADETPLYTERAWKDLLDRMNVADKGAVFEWGFGGTQIQKARELIDAGLLPVWFADDPRRARARHSARPRANNVEQFDEHVAGLATAGLPEAVPEFLVVHAFRSDGSLRDMAEIVEEIRGRFRGGANGP